MVWANKVKGIEKYKLPVVKTDVKYSLGDAVNDVGTTTDGGRCVLDLLGVTS